MVDPNHPRLSIVRQCRLVSIARSSFSDEGTGETPLTLRLMRLIDEQFLETPFFGSRQMTRWLRRQGDTVSRKRVRRLMRRLGVHALFQRPRTSQPHPAHRIYPYLLRDLPITRPNHVWCTDVTDIPLQRGFLYLVAVMDWASRTVLSWRLSNTLDARFCVEALHAALERDGPPEIFNSDQGSQFTSVDFTDVLTEAGIRISMDGKGRWMDNVFIERLWRSLKYECVYLSEFQRGSDGLEQRLAIERLQQVGMADVGRCSGCSLCSRRHVYHFRCCSGRQQAQGACKRSVLLMGVRQIGDREVDGTRVERSKRESGSLVSRVEDDTALVLELPVNEFPKEGVRFDE